MASNTVWGLDIGNSAIKAVKMVRTSDGCMVESFDIINIPASDDDKDRPKRVEAALTTLVSNHRFGSDPVYVAVAGNLCLHREFQLPPGSEDKLSDLVQYEAKQQIPFPLEQVEWGFERFDDPNGVGVALMAVRKNDIQDLLTLTEKFRLNLRGITPSAMALFNFIQYEFKPDGTTLILDAGAKGIDFVVMNKRQIYFRTIQIAGRELTRVLENKFKVSYEKAEELKRNISKSAQAEKIMSVIEPTLRQLGAEVQRTIGFYKSKARGQRIQQCYLLGHTFRLPKIADFLQGQVREAPFALVEGLQRVKLDGSINAEVWNSEFPTLAVAIGLGVQGLGISELTLNLIPQTKKSELVRARWKGWVAAAAAVVLAALWVSYTEAQKAEAKFREKLTELEADMSSVNKYQKEEVTAVVGLPEKKLMLERYARVEHDCGKISHALPKLAALQADDGKPFFGPERKVFLTGIYVSRRPPGAKDGRQEGVDRDVEKSEALSGPQGLYAAFGNPKVADPTTLPPELRPDLPLVVALVGEVESTNAVKITAELQKCLEKVPEVKDVRGKLNTATPATYTEPVLQYDWNGALKIADKAAGTSAAPATPAPAAPAAAKEVTYVQFSVVLRWCDLSDPDREPVEAAAPAASAKPGETKKGK